MSNLYDESQIRCWFDIMKQNKKLTEVRLIGNNKVASGYFTDVDILLREIKPYLSEYNAYFIINSISPECYGRQQHDKIIVKPKNTTTDSEIIGRDYVFLDLDAHKVAGVNATDEEVERTKQKAREVYRFLKANSFNEPIVIFSANGVHFYLRCALMPTEENNDIIKRFTQAMGMLFSDEYVDIDQKIYNLARIAKIPGTYSRKGSIESKERPQRLCYIVKYPHEQKVNDIEYFKKIADLYPKEDEAKPNRYNNYSTEKFSLDAFIEKHNIPVTHKVQVADGTKYYLEHCLFNEQHKGKDAILFQHNNGAIGYYCFHHSCTGNDWRKVREMYEPDAYAPKPFDPNYRRDFRVKREVQPIVQTAEKGEVWLKMSGIAKPKFDVGDYIPSGVKQIDDLMIGFKRKHVTVWSGYRGCVDCDTEYFNGTEWKKISDYTNGEKVLQYNADGTATLVMPKLYHKIPCDTLTWMHNKLRTINQCVCDDHNLVYVSSKGNIVKRNFGILKNRFTKNGRINGYIIPTFTMNNKGIDWSELEIRMELAISAEGYLFHNRLNKKHRVRINVKHQYKKDELEFLLNALNVKYEKKNYAPKDKDMITYLFYWDKAAKVFPEEWYGMNQEQFKTVYDNITIWDGFKTKGGGYRTTEKKNADFVQFCCASLGYKAHIGIDDRKNKTCYIITFSVRHKRGISLNSDDRNGGCTLAMEEYKTKDGFKYCFTVDSGMLVLRRGDAINITGNCGKSSLLNMLILNGANYGYKSALWTGELDAAEEKSWLYMQAAGKPYNKETKNGFYYTPENICDKIDPWIDKFFWIFNNEYKNNFSQIIGEVRALKKRENIDFIILDNLMTLDIDDLDGDKNDRQKNLMYTLTCLAKELNIHIHIVAHPNKSGTFLRPNNISGSGHIPDLAQNVFILHRINRDFAVNAKDFLTSATIHEIQDSRCSNTIEICKCRDRGSAVDTFIKLYFEPESRRFKDSIAESIIYGWQDELGEISSKNPQISDFQPTVEEQTAKEFEASLSPTGEEAPF